MKTGRPVLYELLSGHDAPRAAAPEVNGHTPHHRLSEAVVSPHDPVRWFAPGRSIRVPVGYVFLVIAGVIAVAAGAYMFGYTRGANDESARRAELVAGETELAALAAQQGIRGGGARDAGGSGGTSGAANRQSGGGGSIDARSGSVSDSGSRPLTPSTPAGWGPIESDPRQSGLNYFYLVQKTTKAGATMVAEFCRADGLEAYVVPANNGRDFDVFVAPGHAPEARQSATVKSLESKINEIKIKWKARFGRDEIGISLERYRG
ncbi:MAG: hypothetical protein HRU76_01710 [Phycisphaeraceae bacterium]|nr:hypothetical protein [Phycisphaerales bacterium]QOJ16383.1 MAG: hypothetical protein HRU76_01710 [Phycisphaeraceae bacterium]